MSPSTLFILVLAVVSATDLDKELNSTIEEDGSMSNRIIEGKPARRGQFPYQVAMTINRKGGKALFCGGSLICDSWVLTAGRCVKNATKLTLYFGGFNRAIWPNGEKGLVVRKSKEIHVHPNYNSENNNHDIALIRLRRNVKFTDNIAPISLGKRYVIADMKVTISGWGKTTDDSQLSNRLYYATIRTMKNENCALMNGINLNKETMCCSSLGKEGGCDGDYGGPLVRRGRGKHVQVGVFSYRINKSCNAGFPTVYTRVASYRRWIQQTIGGTCQMVD